MLIVRVDVNNKTNNVLIKEWNKIDILIIKYVIS